MGAQLWDQYALLHFASGVIAYFWGFGLTAWFLAHTTFEVLENSQAGMGFINRNVTWWPGGKPRADSAVNMVGDSVAALLGWWTAYRLDEMGRKRRWYEGP